MKKLTLGLVLASAALGFLTSPAIAADPPRVALALSAADQAFLASLAAPEKTPSALVEVFHGAYRSSPSVTDFPASGT
jgi:hypothetical protein